ncbi:hypothetical protein SAMN05444320_107185 [Streptoalloteichus hindustanus]|uniref:Uncharacterized protein n=1 Tax=Streptoalloteichus hindustanus TaxID=2017 RepID=A0A1M5I9J6_STRHI|nr:hypothetical protein SAMN05444320_107185 [Streptoalloteichus hindustanus]
MTRYEGRKAAVTGATHGPGPATAICAPGR